MKRNREGREKWGKRERMGEIGRDRQTDREKVRKRERERERRVGR